MNKVTLILCIEAIMCVDHSSEVVCDIRFFFFNKSNTSETRKWLSTLRYMFHVYCVLKTCRYKLSGNQTKLCLETMSQKTIQKLCRIFVSKSMTSNTISKQSGSHVLQTQWSFFSRTIIQILLISLTQVNSFFSFYTNQKLNLHLLIISLSSVNLKTQLEIVFVQISDILSKTYLKNKY